jgi:hypothetical protein
MAYQDGPDIQREELKFLLVNYGLWLSPVLVVLLFRKMPILVGACAIPIFVVFVGRMHYVWQYHAYGINVIKKLGDWAWFSTTLIGMGLGLHHRALAAVSGRKDRRLSDRSPVKRA